jgi:uridine kinase
MKIAIIGPRCSGKSTLAADLCSRLENSEIHKEALRVFNEKGIMVPVAENSTKASVRQLFDFTLASLKEMDRNKTLLYLGPR